MVGRSVQVNSLCFTTDDDIKQYLLENISEEKFKELKEEEETQSKIQKGTRLLS